MTNETKTEKATVQPARAWPSYEADHARAELAALRMLCARAPMHHIRTRTRLSWAHIHRLAELVAEDSAAPAPRNVIRDRRTSRPARVRVVRPRRSAPPAAGEEDRTAGPSAKPPEREPEQLAFISP
ncbi:hypothetical protein ACIOG4_28590 [Streptomyces microflavus]|uniref:hypothetical protein n=1 Tax=Streptomyces microflavus TaxID=1919 RepID=UPI003809D4A6